MTRRVKTWIAAGANLRNAKNDDDPEGVVQRKVKSMTIGFNLTANVPDHIFTDFQSTYVPSITANNINLSTNTPEFCVGQQVNFGVSWNATPSYCNSVQHWTIPDKYVNETRDYSYSCTTYVKDTDLLTNSTIQCWYVNGSGGKASIGMNLQFANGQTASIATDGSFTIYRPSFTGFHNFANGFSWSTPFLNAITDWDVTLNSKYDGAFGYTQILNSDNPNSYYYTGGFNYLDGNSEIYGNQITNGPQQYIVTNLVSHFLTFQDSPQSLAAPCATMAANFSDYLRFQPAGGIYVTIATNGWYMNGSACLTGPISPDDLPLAGNLINDDTFPTWVSTRPGGGH
jgi:hypothetical protein